ncbi:glycosyltransferase [Marinilactibacillus psychrotolerans]|uniref:glycosyltransferase n=1 Tax=Marinilactibacillus psychrotolerans TaxID=191770 RepID=UPI0038868006
MNGYFIFYRDINYEKLNGIDKKVISQLETFKDAGINCKLEIMQSNKKDFWHKLYNTVTCRLPFGNTDPTWRFNPKFNEVDFIYLRRPTSINYPMLKVLRKIKKKNPKIKIIMEIPTYPYDDELKSKVKDYPRYLKDIYSRRKLEGLVDRIAVQNNVDKIFNIPTLNFTNGIRVKEIKPREVLKTKGINICAVASMEPWQGYERVILGLSNYYKNGGNVDVNIYLVGEGNEKATYEKMVNELNLNDHIHFEGFLSGKQLERIYSKSDIALDSFGRYKTKNEFSTSLKSREYLAKGLPIVSGSKIDIINKSFPYYYEFASNSSTVDFKKIIEFYHEIYLAGKVKDEIIQEIRDYAFLVCDMSISMNEIITYIKKGK